MSWWSVTSNLPRSHAQATAQEMAQKIQRFATLPQKVLRTKVNEKGHTVADKIFGIKKDPKTVSYVDRRQGQRHSRRRPTRSDRHPIQITGRVVHHSEAIPMLPAIGQRFRRRLPGKVEAQRRNQSDPQPRLNPLKELGERIHHSFIPQHSTPLRSSN